MKILITGGAGFIGSHLRDRLEGHTIYSIDKKWGSSTAHPRFFNRDSEVDLIIHLGANCSSQISLREPAIDFTDNVVGTFNVCEFSRRHGNIPIIFNSTMKIYPGEDGIIPPYGRSKLVGEQYLEMYHKIYGLDYIINRPSSVYGPGQNGSDDGGWFTWFIKAALTKQVINIYGSGRQSRDVLYIDDHIDLLVDQINNFELYKNQSFDFGGGLENEVSLRELIDKLDYHHNICYKLRLKGDVTRFVAGYDEVRKINGWRPKVDWETGMERTKAWLERF